MHYFLFIDYAGDFWTRREVSFLVPLKFFRGVPLVLGGTREEAQRKVRGTTEELEGN